MSQQTIDNWKAQHPEFLGSLKHSGEIKQVLVPDRISTEPSKKDIKPQF